MDINSMKSKYEGLKGEILTKGRNLAKVDNTAADLSPDPGDVFVQNYNLESSDGGKVAVTGGVRLENGGAPSHIDLEETAPDGAKARYVFDKDTKDGATASLYLKKTDILKQKATVMEPSDKPATLKIEETNFVESALSPQIEERSEKLKGQVLDAAESVALLDNSDADKDKRPGIINVDKAVAFSPKSGKQVFSGTVERSADGERFDKVEIADTQGNEYYLTKTSNYDFYKKAAPDSMESTQIFDKGGPKLVLFQEEKEGPAPQ